MIYKTTCSSLVTDLINQKNRLLILLGPKKSGKKFLLKGNRALR